MFGRGKTNKIVGEEANPSIKEVVYGIDRLAKTIFGGITITHKYERQPKPIRGRIAITMEDGRDYLGVPFQVSKWGGRDFAALPCKVTVRQGLEISNVYIEWEYDN